MPGFSGSWGGISDTWIPVKGGARRPCAWVLERRGVSDIWVLGGRGVGAGESWTPGFPDPASPPGQRVLGRGAGRGERGDALGKWGERAGLLHLPQARHQLLHDVRGGRGLSHVGQ